MKKEGQEVPIDVLNNLGVLHFEKGEFEVCGFIVCVGGFFFFGNLIVTAIRKQTWIDYYVYSSICQLAQQTFREALGDGVWVAFIDGKEKAPSIDADASIFQYKDMNMFLQLEKEGHLVKLPWNKVTTLFNLARLLEQLHNTETAAIFYRLILFKVRVYMRTCIHLIVFFFLKQVF